MGVHGSNFHLTASIGSTSSLATLHWLFAGRLLVSELTSMTDFVYIELYSPVGQSTELSHVFFFFPCSLFREMMVAVSTHQAKATLQQMARRRVDGIAVVPYTSQRECPKNSLPQSAVSKLRHQENHDEWIVCIPSAVGGRRLRHRRCPRGRLHSCLSRTTPLTRCWWSQHHCQQQKGLFVRVVYPTSVVTLWREVRRGRWSDSDIARSSLSFLLCLFLPFAVRMFCLMGSSWPLRRSWQHVQCVPSKRGAVVIIIMAPIEGVPVRFGVSPCTLTM